MLYNSSMKLTYKHNNNITYSCKYHIVWCPKYRFKVLIEGLDFRLKEINALVAIELNSELIEVEVMPDRVQVLVECDPQFGIAKLVRYMKGRSSRYLRQEFPCLKSRLPTLWTNSYFVATVGGAPIERD